MRGGGSLKTVLKLDSGILGSLCCSSGIHRSKGLLFQKAQQSCLQFGENTTNRQGCHINSKQACDLASGQPACAGETQPLLRRYCFNYKLLGPYTLLFSVHTTYPPTLTWTQDVALDHDCEFSFVLVLGLESKASFSFSATKLSTLAIHLDRPGRRTNLSNASDI